MPGRIGILGAGHLAGYLMEGLHNRGLATRVLVADCDPEHAETLAGHWGARVAAANP